MNRTASVVIAVAGLLVTISSCGIFKGGARKKAATDTTQVATATSVDTVTLAPRTDSATAVVPPPANTALISELAPLYTNNFSYTTFDGKAKMKYGNGDKNQDFTANFRIKKDSVIWVAISALGGMVQVARVYITPDSIRVINYLNREVILMPMSQAAGLLPVPVKFQTLQNMIVGQPLVDDGTVTAAADSGNVWKLQVDDDRYSQQLMYSKADSTMHTGELSTNNPTGPHGIIRYNNYNNVNGRKFSDERDITFSNAGMQYQLNMNFVNAAFDQNLDFPFSIPKSFTLK